ncbi:MAG: hypothetical protein LWX11_02665, partial [Firmicutes bacterium]|nr:hypothetical protein [Bacillota bacterium]
MNLRHYLIAITLSTVSMALPGQHPNYQKNLENTWNQPLSEVFGEPIHRVVPAGSWTLTASINPDYVGNPAFFHLQGSYREKGGTFLYREVIVSLSQQVALLRTAHPDWSDEEIARHLLFAELRFHGVDQLPQE